MSSISSSFQSHIADSALHIGRQPFLAYLLPASPFSHIFVISIMFMRPAVLHPSLLPTHLPPPQIFPISAIPSGFSVPPPPFPIPCLVAPHVQQAQPSRPQSPRRLPVTITPLPSPSQIRRHSCGSSARSSSCAASTSSNHQSETGSSQDSGRATGGLASSLSPMDDCNDGLPMYEFEIPNSLVGLIIGVKGKTIKELSSRTDVKMLIRPHHAPEKSDTHQICQVRGKRDQINKCLQMLRRRFPNERFPELNLQPVLPPILPTSLFDALAGQPSWLSLPENVSCEVVCSSITDPGHFFVQQPTHPSFPSLAVLDRYMFILYSSGTSIPELPKPCQNGLLCAAPVLGAWFRAVTVAYYEESDEVLVRFVDYGGYETIARGDLRQIRTDLMSLPFQATECHLAHVQPIDGTSQWPEESLQFFHKICMGKVVIATVVGTHVDDKMPMVEIVINSEEDGKTVRLDEALMSAGFAKASDPSKMSRFSVKRPSFSAQQSTVMVS